MKPLLPEILVNGEVIPAALIAAEAQNHPAPPGKPGIAWQAAARALALRTLLLQEARRRGIETAPAEVAPGQMETEDEALIRQLLDQAVVPAPVSEAELQAHYQAQPDRFRAPALYEAAHILLPVRPDDPAALTGATALAEMILAELASDPRRFDALAGQHSACASRANGGRLGQISAGDTVAEFEAALDKLVEGQIAPAPVRSRYGLHIIRLDARAEGEVLPFAAVQGPLRAAREKAGWAQAAQAFVTALSAAATVEGITLRAA